MDLNKVGRTQETKSVTISSQQLRFHHDTYLSTKIKISPVERITVEQPFSEETADRAVLHIPDLHVAVHLLNDGLCLDMVGVIAV